MTQTSDGGAPPPATPVLDPTLTMALAMASEAAYDDFECKSPQLPAGWSFVARWTGWDPEPAGEGKEERYGVLLRNDADPGTYIVAFRGTASLDDALDDADFPTRPFVADAGSAPAGIEVASGFYGIYNDIGGAMTQSMRAQVFALLAQYAPARVYVTGHSLGGALAHLFAFDLSFGPLAPAFAALCTFASPRVGTQAWRDAYDARIASARSTRVYNQHDLVPELPPKDFGYRDVGQGFPVAFERQSLPVLFPLSRHALLNYIAVLQHALPATPQAWAGTFADSVDAKRAMVSAVPAPASG